ncbi:MAG: hotdog fold thioesterase [Crocinitomicaceae bacterium]|jgi:acyl-CoA thioesterase|nr:hotdog fold thioesterase [Crocinitomicaceae bacterium]MDG2464298.1 hotdog fold thioesterase [Crocinitomicaceae bacterium]
MSPKEIYTKMMEKDEFSRLLGMELTEINTGSCTLKLTVTRALSNGFQIAHGGIAYSLSDSALAFASNAYGQKCVSIETSISHLKSVQIGETITAFCTEINRGNSIALYAVQCKNENNDLISVFKGTVKISRSNWE